MKKIINIPESVKARLLNIADATKTPYIEVLQYYGIERFLYRFSRIKYGGEFFLKGALMFSAWDVPERRRTLDIDFLARHDNKIEEIAEIVAEACNIKSEEDGIIFKSETIKAKKIKEDADYEGVRVQLIGYIERTRIPLQIDFGFGDAVYPEPKNIEYPVLLDFPAPRLKGYSPETVIAEKFEAMVKLGSLNSRMKDFYDVWLLTRKFDFKPEELAKAVEMTFEHRNTPQPHAKTFLAEEIYDEKSDRQTLWQAFLKKNGIKNAPDKLHAVADEIEKFLSEPVKIIKQQRSFK